MNRSIFVQPRSGGDQFVVLVPEMRNGRTALNAKIYAGEWTDQTQAVAWIGERQLLQAQVLVLTPPTSEWTGRKRRSEEFDPDLPSGRAHVLILEDSEQMEIIGAFPTAGSALFYSTEERSMGRIRRKWSDPQPLFRPEEYAEHVQLVGRELESLSLVAAPAQPVPVIRGRQWPAG
jgi:hypothetical protein